METGNRESQLYWIGQLFEDKWTPQDTPLADLSCETIHDVPLKRYYGDSARRGART